MGGTVSKDGPLTKMRGLGWRMVREPRPTWRANAECLSVPFTVCCVR